VPKSSRELVDLILLGPTGDRRQLQDSPILGDVWIKYAANPRKQWDLLITPEKKFPAGAVAGAIAKAVRKLRRKLDPEDKDSAKVACLQALIAAKLTFQELLEVVVPMTVWWKDRNIQDQLAKTSPADTLAQTIPQLQKCLNLHEDEDTDAPPLRYFTQLKALDRYVALAGVILWASKHGSSAQGIAGDLEELKDPGEVVAALVTLSKAIQSVPAPDRKEASVWQISLNRRAMAALEKSVQAVKGDAARTLFKVTCDEIAWAVLDSGIAADHMAFRLSDNSEEHRIVKAYDFSDIRTIVSLDNLDASEDQLTERVGSLRKLKGKQRKAAVDKLKSLAEDARNDRPIHWELVEEFITVEPKTRPDSSHGTHVAGILGGRADRHRKHVPVDGMCPDIKLYDFRVLSKSLSNTEFAIIAALQFIRHLNERSGFMVIHGANLSLSIPHDVRNFACGRTPICNECERLVENGVVVVAAAGNLGYQSFETKEGRYDSYAAFSITDPGNADGVITVGATHRFWPHTYGVSFFSSRGPTGDGRLKPDLVAPGERIRSALVDQGWGELDGTSMAAPHVSGAAAMLMARYSELIGQPRRIKKTLCESATDLGRERTFQGHGMLDVLRAFQRM
jgi:serine protease AprX